MKQGILTMAFILYQFFTPFLFVDCGGGEDIPYDRTISSDENVVSPCDQCEQNDFLTEECVDIMDQCEAEEESAASE
jgi:hypothetical protein